MERGCGSAQPSRAAAAAGQRLPGSGCAADGELAHVRCCSLSGDSCLSVCEAAGQSRQHGSNTASPRTIRDAPKGETSWATAAAECTSHGRRLCTARELGAGVCCQTGCQMDWKPAWTGEACSDPTITLLSAAKLSSPDPLQLYGHSKFPLAAGCKQLYIDLGSNTGVQLLKLFEPQRFAGATLVRSFSRVFDRASRVCAIGFEPNPRHAKRLQKLATILATQGHRVTIVTAAVGLTNNSVPLAVHGGGLETGATMELGIAGRTNLSYVPVVVLDLLDFLRRHVDWAGVRVATVKMDIEGSEFKLLPALLADAQVGCGVKEWWVEFHGHLGEKRRREQQALLHGAPACTSVSILDDESYSQAELQVKDGARRG